MANNLPGGYREIPLVDLPEDADAGQPQHAFTNERLIVITVRRTDVDHKCDAMGCV